MAVEKLKDMVQRQAHIMASELEDDPTVVQTDDGLSNVLQRFGEACAERAYEMALSDVQQAVAEASWHARQ